MALTDTQQKYHIQMQVSDATTPLEPKKHLRANKMEDIV